MQFGTKTAQVFINSSPDYNRRALNELMNSDPFMPGVGQAGGLSVEMRYTQPMPLRINLRMAAKKRTDATVVCPLLHGDVKTGQYKVVLVQDVYPFSAGSFNAPVPNARQTIVRWFAMNYNPFASDLANQFHRCAVGRTIIHHLDLHLFRAGILLQNAPQRVL